MARKRTYRTDLTDAEWAVLEPLLPPPARPPPRSSLSWPAPPSRSAWHCEPGDQGAVPNGRALTLTVPNVWYQFRLPST